MRARCGEGRVRSDDVDVRAERAGGMGMLGSKLDGAERDEVLVGAGET